jgi:hypothetical protein
MRDIKQFFYLKKRSTTFEFEVLRKMQTIKRVNASVCFLAGDIQIHFRVQNTPEENRYELY